MTGVVNTHEMTYQSLNPIERELRRRIFWLLYAADRAKGITNNEATLINESDVAHVALPAEMYAFKAGVC